MVTKILMADSFSTLEERANNTDPLNQGSRPPPDQKVNVRIWTMTQLDHWWKGPIYGAPPMINVHTQSVINGVVSNGEPIPYPVEEVPDSPVPVVTYAPPSLTSNGWFLEVADPPRSDGSLTEMANLQNPIFPSGWMITHLFHHPNTNSGWTAKAKRFQLITAVPLLDSVKRTWLVLRRKIGEVGPPIFEPVSSITLELPAGETEGPMVVLSHPPPSELGEGEVDTGDEFELAPVAFEQIPLGEDGITHAGHNNGSGWVIAPISPTSTPRFSRWRNGFTEPGGQFKQDWIAGDPDRVILSISADVIDPAVPWVSVKVGGITGVPGRTTDDGLVQMTPKNGGWESEPFLFVTDDIDDTQYNGDQGVDNDLHDQTRLASFGADLSIKFIPKGQTAPIEIPMGKMSAAQHTVAVELNVLQGNDPVTAADKAKAEEHFEVARLLYRQIGVDLVQQGAVNVVTLPTGFADFWAQPGGGYIYDTTRVDWASTVPPPSGETFAEYLARISAGTTALKVYYIRADLDSTIGGGDTLGWGILRGDYCINELFDASPRGGYLTAHEIGHVLGADHTPPPNGDYPHCIMNSALPLNLQLNHRDPRRFRSADEVTFPGGKFFQ